MNDENISFLDSVITCKELENDFPISINIRNKVNKWRDDIKNILNGSDKRKIAIIGPCSIHDYESAITYAKLLYNLSEKIKDKVLIIMRTYFEKPRTTIGWKGFINDPDLDNSFDINKGVKLARKLLIDINDIGLPVGCEFLDTITPQYFSELICWGAIGARTVESQLHRQLASGLSMPIGFKNGTSGDIKVAQDAIMSSQTPHVFFGINKENKTVRVRTKGNKFSHLILRGGQEPNYKNNTVDKIQNTKIIIDCSHGNSNKNHLNQEKVLEYILEKYTNNLYKNVVGFMIESNIFPGSQILNNNKENLKYGISITDACIGINDTEKIMMNFFDKFNPN